MASFALIEGQINRLPRDQRPPLTEAFREAVTQLRFGRPVHAEPSQNFAAGFYEATTPGVPSTEFSIRHGFGRAPYLAIGVLDLRAEGAQLAPLAVSRAADAERLYLTSTVADAPIMLYVEG